jgi:hypothetical protein
MNGPTIINGGITSSGTNAWNGTNTFKSEIGVINADATSTFTVGIDGNNFGLKYDSNASLMVDDGGNCNSNGTGTMNVNNSNGLYVFTLTTGNGQVYCNNGILSNTSSSDISLKKNIVPLALDISNIYNKLISLEPVNYEWIVSNVNDKNKVKYGFIANEVQKIFPDIVSTLKDLSGNEKLGYDPVSLLPITISCIKKQNDDIIKLQEKNNALEERMSALEAALLSSKQ